MSDTEQGFIADATGVGSPTPSREQEETPRVTQDFGGRNQLY